MTSSSARNERGYLFQERNGVPVVSWPAVNVSGVDAIVTTREGGVSTGPFRSLNLGLAVGDDHSSVITNRSIAASLVGASLDHLVFADQIHGNNTTHVETRDRGRGALESTDAVSATDALVTASRETVLVIQVADCIPIVLVDPTASILAVIHAGWRGLVNGVIGTTIDAMSNLGSDPTDLVAGIGPGASPQTYQVGDDVAAKINERFCANRDGLNDRRIKDDISEVLRPDKPGHWLLNLWEASRRALIDGGVPPLSISVADIATGTPGPFYSHRQGSPSGRFALLAKLLA